MLMIVLARKRLARTIGSVVIVSRITGEWIACRSACSLIATGIGAWKAFTGS